MNRFSSIQDNTLLTAKYEYKEELRQKNRQDMTKEGMFYIQAFNSAYEEGLDHNSASIRAVAECIRYFSTRGKSKGHFVDDAWVVNNTTAEQVQRGRLVYIGAYKPLQVSLKATLSVSSCLEVLCREIDGFDAVLQALKTNADNKVQLLKSVLVFLRVANEELYQELYQSYLECRIVN